MAEFYMFLRYELTGLFLEGFALLILSPILSREAMVWIFENGVSVAALLALAAMPIGYGAFQFLENNLTGPRRDPAYEWLRKEGQRIMKERWDNKAISDAHIEALFWLTLYGESGSSKENLGGAVSYDRELIPVVRSFVWHGIAQGSLSSLYVLVLSVGLAATVSGIIELLALSPGSIRLPTDETGWLRTLSIWAIVVAVFGAWRRVARRAAKRTLTESRTLEAAILKAREFVFEKNLELVNNEAWLREESHAHNVTPSQLKRSKTEGSRQQR